MIPAEKANFTGMTKLEKAENVPKAQVGTRVGKIATGQKNPDDHLRWSKNRPKKQVVPQSVVASASAATLLRSTLASIQKAGPPKRTGFLFC